MHPRTTETANYDRKFIIKVTVHDRCVRERSSMTAERLVAWTVDADVSRHVTLVAHFFHHGTILDQMARLVATMTALGRVGRAIHIHGSLGALSGIVARLSALEAHA